MERSKTVVIEKEQKPKIDNGRPKTIDANNKPILKTDSRSSIPRKMLTKSNTFPSQIDTTGNKNKNETEVETTTNEKGEMTDSERPKTFLVSKERTLDVQINRPVLERSGTFCKVAKDESITPNTGTPKTDISVEVEKNKKTETKKVPNSTEKKPDITRANPDIKVTKSLDVPIKTVAKPIPLPAQTDPLKSSPYQTKDVKESKDVKQTKSIKDLKDDKSIQPKPSPRKKENVDSVPPKQPVNKKEDISPSKTQIKKDDPKSSVKTDDKLNNKGAPTAAKVKHANKSTQVNLIETVPIKKLDVKVQVKTDNKTQKLGNIPQAKTTKDPVPKAKAPFVPGHKRSGSLDSVLKPVKKEEDEITEIDLKKKMILASLNERKVSNNVDNSNGQGSVSKGTNKTQSTKAAIGTQASTNFGTNVPSKTNNKVQKTDGNNNNKNKNKLVDSVKKGNDINISKTKSMISEIKEKLTQKITKDVNKNVNRTPNNTNTMAIDTKKAAPILAKNKVITNAINRKVVRTTPIGARSEISVGLKIAIPTRSTTDFWGDYVADPKDVEFGEENATGDIFKRGDRLRRTPVMTDERVEFVYDTETVSQTTISDIGGRPRKGSMDSLTKNVRRRGSIDSVSKYSVLNYTPRSVNPKSEPIKPELRKPETVTVDSRKPEEIKAETKHTEPDDTPAVEVHQQHIFQRQDKCLRTPPQTPSIIPDSDESIVTLQRNIDFEIGNNNRSKVISRISESNEYDHCYDTVVRDTTETKHYQYNNTVIGNRSQQDHSHSRHVHANIDYTSHIDRSSVVPVSHDNRSTYNPLGDVTDRDNSHVNTHTKDVYNHPDTNKDRPLNAHSSRSHNVDSALAIIRHDDKHVIISNHGHRHVNNYSHNLLNERAGINQYNRQDSPRNKHSGYNSPRNKHNIKESPRNQYNRNESPRAIASPRDITHIKSSDKEFMLSTTNLSNTSSVDMSPPINDSIPGNFPFDKPQKVARKFRKRPESQISVKSDSFGNSITNKRPSPIISRKMKPFFGSAESLNVVSENSGRMNRPKLSRSPTSLSDDIQTSSLKENYPLVNNNHIKSLGDGAITSSFSQETLVSSDAVVCSDTNAKFPDNHRGITPDKIKLVRSEDVLRARNIKRHKVIISKRVSQGGKRSRSGHSSRRHSNSSRSHSQRSSRSKSNVSDGDSENSLYD